MGRSLSAILLVAFASCTPAPAPSEGLPPPSRAVVDDAGAPPLPEGATLAPAGAVRVASPTSDAGTPRCDVRHVPPALAEMPCTPDDPYVGLRDHGFSKDGSLFGHCASSCEVCGEVCTFVEVATGRTKKLQFSDEHRGGTDAQHAADARHDAPLLAFVRKHYPEEKKGDASPLPRAWSGPFRHDDVVFASKSSYDPTTGKATIAFGGRVGDGPVVYPWTKSFGPHVGWSYPPTVAKELRGAEREKALAEGRAAMREMFTVEPPLVADIDVSRDGKYFGVVFMTSGTRFVEYADMIFVETDKAVARLANEGGFALHQQKEWPRAATLFARAGQLAPDEALYAYNEACARARAGDEAKAEDALRRAVKKGGASFAARARKDEDLASVRAIAWFAAVVGR